MNRSFRPLLVWMLVCAIVLTLTIRGAADIPITQKSGTTTTTGATDKLILSGQSACSVAISGTGSAFTIVPQATTDGSNWITVSTINSGSISANGTYSGNMASTGLFAFRIDVTGIGGGTINYTLTCSAAGPGSSQNMVTQLIGGTPNTTWTIEPQTGLNLLTGFGYTDTTALHFYSAAFASLGFYMTSSGNLLWPDTGSNIQLGPFGTCNVQPFAYGINYGTGAVYLACGDDGSDGVPFGGFEAFAQDFAASPLPAHTLIGCDLPTSSGTVPGDCGALGPMEANSTGAMNHLSYVAPIYKVDGTKQAKTTHCVKDTVTAGGASTVISLTGTGNAFTTMVTDIGAVDNTAGTKLAAPAFSAISKTGFTMATTSAHVYGYSVCGW